MALPPTPRIRTRLENDLRPVVTRRFGMEPAIRARTPAPLGEAREALEEYLTESGITVVQDVELDADGDGEAEEIRFLKVGRAKPFTQYRPQRSQIPLGRKAVKTGMAMPHPSTSSAVNVDPERSSVLPASLIFRECHGETHVSAARPSSLLAVFGARGIDETDVDLECALWEALEEGLPAAEMPDQEPPVRSVDGPRVETKAQFETLLSLPEDEYALHLSTGRPLREMRNRVPDALSRPGQQVLGPVANGQVLFVLHPRRMREALAAEPGVGVLAPFPVFVFEADDRTHVRAVCPTTALAFLDGPTVQDLLVEMEVLLWEGILEAVPDGSVEDPGSSVGPDDGRAPDTSTGTGMTEEGIDD